MSATPVASKSAGLPVTTVIPCPMAAAAISASRSGRGYQVSAYQVSAYHPRIVRAHSLRFAAPIASGVASSTARQARAGLSGSPGEGTNDSEFPRYTRNGTERTE